MQPETTPAIRDSDQRLALDLLLGRGRTDPYPLYTMLRNERPLYRTGLGYVLVSRYADVRRLLRTPSLPVGDLLGERCARTPAFEGSALQELQRHWLTFLDPPTHTTARHALESALPRTDDLAEVIDDTVDELLRKTEGVGSFDVVSDFARPLTTTVICHMLGVPTRLRDVFSRWSDELGCSLDHIIGRASMKRADAAAHAATLYGTAAFHARMADPKDDILSRLAANVGDGLSEEQLVSLGILVAGAGQETAVNLIGNAVIALADHHDQAELLAAEPSVAGSAVEEFLRYDSPIQMVARTPNEPLTVGNGEINAGERMFLVLGSANRDESAFGPTADDLDLRRAPNRHLAFSGGVHHCLGAQLGRLEARIALPALANHARPLRLATRPTWRKTLNLRGPATLRLDVSACSRSKLALHEATT